MFQKEQKETTYSYLQTNSSFFWEVNKGADFNHSSSNLHNITNLSNFKMVSVSIKSRAVLVNCSVMVNVKSLITLDIPYSQMDLETSAREAATQCAT